MKNSYLSIIKKSEVIVLYFINRCFKCRLLDLFMSKITYVGGASFAIIFTLAIILLGGKQGKTAGWHILVALVFSQGLVQTFKLSFKRLRPFQRFDFVNILGQLPHDASFPSGHTTAGFAIATTVAMYWPTVGIVAIFLAAIMAISRVYLGLHYPSDILAGTLLGIISAMGISWLL